MCGAVLFSGALARAVRHLGGFDLAVEVGPHPALRGPATATLGGVEYTGLLARGRSDVGQLAAALGFVWTRLGTDGVRFSAVQALTGAASTTLLKNLPPYPFEHQRAYWAGSRFANHFRHRCAPPNPVLGAPCSEGATPGEIQWRNVLRPGETAWLRGHVLQGQTVFPATGYVNMTVEAVRALALDAGAALGLLRLSDVEIPRAITFDDNDAGIETVFSVSSVGTAGGRHHGRVGVLLGGRRRRPQRQGESRGPSRPPVPDTLPAVATDPYNVADVDGERFYANLSRLGYDYSPPFCGVADIRRKPGYSVGTLLNQSGSAWENGLVVHPGMLDSALQTVFTAWSFPGDTQLWALHVPLSVSSTVNPSRPSGWAASSAPCGTRPGFAAASRPPSSATSSCTRQTGTPSSSSRAPRWCPSRGRRPAPTSPCSRASTTSRPWTDG